MTVLVLHLGDEREGNSRLKGSEKWVVGIRWYTARNVLGALSRAEWTEAKLQYALTDYMNYLSISSRHHLLFDSMITDVLNHDLLALSASVYLILWKKSDPQSIPQFGMWAQTHTYTTSLHAYINIDR